MPPEPAAADPVSQAVEALQALPWGVHALVAACLGIGIVLWLAGRRILKPAIVVLGTLLGAGFGVLVLPHTPAADHAPMWAGALAGAVLGAVAGILLYRFAMAVAFGIVLGAAAPLAAAVLIGPLPPQTREPLAPDELYLNGVSRAESPDDPVARLRSEAEGLRDRVLDRIGGQTDETEGPASPIDPQMFTGNETVDRAVRSGAEKVHAFSQAAWEELRAEWDELPGAHQAILAGSSIGGLIAGVLVGLVVPSWAAAAVTAMFGAAIWLPSLLWLLRALDAVEPGRLDFSAGGWLLLWGGVSAVGMVAQWSGLLRRRAGRGGEKST